MDLSYEIREGSRLRKEIEQYTQVIRDLKVEREELLDKHSKAVFSKDKRGAKGLLLKLSANSLLMDAYRIYLNLIEFEMRGF